MDNQDVNIINHGSIVQIEPLTKLAEKWIDENCQTEGWQWMGKTLCVDWRCAEPIIDGMQADGLQVA